ncbi:MAG: YdeI/OmpD-associated family protein [Gemmataceae bacterium]|nr:YdeI/OmpD-associated family protein [Gemmataceae bacterium]
MRQEHIEIRGAHMKLANLQETKSTIRFSAKLLRPEATEKIGSWTLLTLPKNASAKLPSRDMTMVEGTINGFPFRAALEPNGSGSHGLRVNKALQDAAGADVGDTVTVEITRVGEEPELWAPMDLRKALAAAPPAQALWAQITPMARRDWILWIISAKQEETRRRRIENACDMLATGKRRPCCMPGINWRTKDSDVTRDETWLPLPNSKSRARSTK